MKKITPIRSRHLSTVLVAVLAVLAIAAPPTHAAPEQQEVVYHLHNDHLGSVRRITDADGNVVESRDYLPFGRQVALDPDGDPETTLSFTGHERDDHGAGAIDDWDYMHARYYSPWLGRFGSVDPVLGRPERPQSWNRYSYAGNRPVLYVDPDGRIDVLFIRISEEAKQLIDEASEHLGNSFDGGIGPAASLGGETQLGPVKLQAKVGGKIKVDGDGNVDAEVRSAVGATVAGKGSLLASGTISQPILVDGQPARTGPSVDGGITTRVGSTKMSATKVSASVKLGVVKVSGGFDFGEFALTIGKTAMAAAQVLRDNADILDLEFPSLP